MRYCIKTVVAPEAVLLLNPFWGIPLGAFPSKGIAIHGAGLFEGIVDWGDPGRPARIAVLTRQMRLVHLLILIYGFSNCIIAAGPLAVAARIHVAHVNLGLSVNHPLRQIFATSRALSDTDRGPTTQPVIA